MFEINQIDQPNLLRSTIKFDTINSTKLLPFQTRTLIPGLFERSRMLSEQEEELNDENPKSEEKHEGGKNRECKFCSAAILA